MGSVCESESVQVNAIFLTACAVLFFVPLYFVLNSVYQDGVFGRLALLCISFCSAMFLLEAAFGTPIQVPPLVVFLVSSFAVFATWHLGRFHFRVLKKENQWKPQSQTLRT